MSLFLLGVVTSAGLAVNGVELRVDAQTAVLRNGAPSTARAIEAGELVAVRAQGDERAARALSVAILDAVIGPVTAVDAPAGTIHVLGDAVRLDPTTRYGDGLSRARLLAAQAGERLRVCGLRLPDGSLLATRIEAAPAALASRVGPSLPEPAPGERFIVEGYVAGSPASGEVLVGGLGVGLDPGAGAPLADGDLVRATGRTNDDGTRVVERARVLDTPFGAPATRERPARPDGRPQRGDLGVR
ncbi:MAG TPA: DUF5666 domain-containing protein [Burkholderiales bacterium]|nr:DUF5666 domain-containing protein [Burkholderiales bacterium]